MHRGGVEAPETCISHPTWRLSTDRVGACEKNQSSHTHKMLPSLVGGGAMLFIRN